MTSPGYVPPSAIGWFVKKQNVFLDVTVTPTADAAFAAGTMLTATATRSANALNDTEQNSTVTGVAAPTAAAGVKKRINRIGSVSSTFGYEESLGSDAWSVTNHQVHTVTAANNRALVVGATARFHSYFGTNTLTSFTASYAGVAMALLGYAWHNGGSVVNNDASLTALFGLLNPAVGTDFLDVSVAQGSNGSGNSFTHLVTAAATYENVSQFGVITSSYGLSTVPRVTTVADPAIVGNGDQYRTVLAIGESDTSTNITTLSPGTSLDYTEAPEVGQMLGDAAGYSAREFTAASALTIWSAVAAELIPIAS